MSDIVIVPGRHGYTSAVWWVDAGNRSVEVDGRRTLLTELSAAGKALGPARVSLLDPVRERWLVTAEGLPEGADVTLRVGVASAGPWASITTRTLSSQARSFTVATGSCFALGLDPQGVIASGYRKLLAKRPVDLRVLTGDQIYMDRDPDTGEYFGMRMGAPYSEPPVRPAERYERQWRDPRWRDFLAATPTLCIGDDHEFWNDYPRRPPYLQYPGRVPAGDFLAAFDVYQSSLNVRPAALKDVADVAAAVRQGRWRTVTVDAPLVSMMILDTRTRREAPGGGATFTPPANLDMLARWAAKLDRPGVLFLGQPISEGAPRELQGADIDAMFDSALRHYPAQYRALCDAVAGAARDVLVVSGDVHWSRLRALDLARKGRAPRHVYEVVCSNLTECLPGEAETSGALPEGAGAWRQCAGSDGRLVRTSAKFTLATLTFTAGAAGAVDVAMSYWGLDAPGAPRLTASVTLK